MKEFANKQKSTPKVQRSIAARGFTIVELLIVIVVIGILAAIVIVAFNGVQNRANDTAIKSDLGNIAKKLELYRTTDAANVYPALTTTGVGIKVSKSAYGNHFTNTVGSYNLLYCRDNGVPEFALIARSKSGKTFAIKNNTSVYETSQMLVTAGTSCLAEGLTNSGAFWAYQSAANTDNEGWPAGF